MATIFLIIPVILIIVLSAVVVKIGAVALKLTGVDEERAFFQALSAFTGTGFTTRDAELVVSNKIRRGIIMRLMILGNAGIITVIVTFIISFVKGGGGPAPIKVVILIGGLYLFYRVLSNKKIMRRLTKKIEKKLRQMGTVDKRPFEEVLHLAEDYGIVEIGVREGFVDAGLTLAESKLSEKNTLVIAIEREGRIIPVPRGDDKMKLGDTLICYGKLKDLKEIASHT